MQILQATLSDVKSIAPLFDLYRQFYGKPAAPEEAETFLRERLEKSESVIFYAAQEGGILGFVQLYPTFSSLSMKPAWILNDLFVLPEMRRQSVGRALMVRATEHSRETRAKGLSLKTATENESAQQLYLSLGWRKDERYLSFDLST